MTTAEQEPRRTPTPALANILNFFAAGQLLIGIGVAIFMWPAPKIFEISNAAAGMAILTSIASLVSGIFFATLTAAIASGLKYLKQIAENTMPSR